MFLGSTSVYAQDISSKKVTLNFKDAPIIEVLMEIQRQTGVSFVYEQAQLQNLKGVTIEAREMELETALRTILKDTGFTHRVTGNTIAIVKGEEKEAVEVIEVTGRVVDEKGDPIPGRQ